MGNILVGLIILLILSGAIYKLYWNKKNGVKCSGCTSCPSNNTCQNVEMKKEKSIV